MRSEEVRASNYEGGRPRALIPNRPHPPRTTDRPLLSPTPPATPGKHPSPPQPRPPSSSTTSVTTLHPVGPLLSLIATSPRLCLHCCSRGCGSQGTSHARPARLRGNRSQPPTASPSRNSILTSPLLPPPPPFPLAHHDGRTV